MKHTKDSMTAELVKARGNGKTREIADLLLLIEYLTHGRGVQTPEVKAARNRQNGRRRAHAPSWSERIGIGDVIVCLEDAQRREFTVSEVSAHGFVCAGEPPFRIGRTQARLVRKVGALGDPAPDARVVACDALYHAICDIADNSNFGADVRSALGAALDAYEAAMK